MQLHSKHLVLVTFICVVLIVVSVWPSPVLGSAKNPSNAEKFQMLNQHSGWVRSHKSQGTGKHGQVDKYVQVSIQGQTGMIHVKDFHPKAKDAVVWVHGINGLMDGFLTNFDSDAYKNLRVIFIDLPSHGLSDDFPPTLTWEDVIDSVHQTIKGLKVKKGYDLVGHSAGADIVRDYSLRYLKEVDDVILLDRAYYPMPGLVQFGITEEVSAAMEWEAAQQSGIDNLTYEQFMNYTHIFWNSGVDSTFHTDKDVLLVRMDPEIYAQFGMPPEIIEYLNQCAAEFAASAVNSEVRISNLTHAQMGWDTPAEFLESVFEFAEAH